MTTIFMFSRVLALTLLLCLAGVRQTVAQEDPPQPALPDIAPRVVEILGQLEISLPSLQRQPLIGFNPPPRVVPIPPERRPFIEDYKQEGIDLPPSPLSPPIPPSASSLVLYPPRSGLLEAGFGRYVSRNLRFRTEWPITRPVAVYSRLDYQGSDGHSPPAARSDATSKYDVFDALVGLQFTTRYAAFGADVDGFVNSYLLYAAEPLAALESDEPPMREGRGGGLALWVRTQALSYVDFNLRARYGTSDYDTQVEFVNDPSLARFFEQDERTIELESDVRAPLSRTSALIGDVGFTGIGLDGASAGSTIRMIDGAGGLQFSAGRGLAVVAKARIMSFVADPHIKYEEPGGPTPVEVPRPPEDGEGEGTYIAPDVSIESYPSRGIRLYVQNRPRAERHTLASLFRRSPYLIDAPAIQPTIYTLDARGGAHVMVGVVAIDLHAGFSRAPNFLTFERSSGAEAWTFDDASFVATRYEDARILYGGGDVTVNLPAGFHVSAGVTVRRGRLADTDEDIPYFGPVLGRGAVSYSFLQGRGYAQAGLTYESARYVDRRHSRKIGDYFDLDLEIGYRFLGGLGAVFRLENVSDGFLERWENYAQAPVVATAGFRVTW